MASVPLTSRVTSSRLDLSSSLEGDERCKAQAVAMKALFEASPLTPFADLSSVFLEGFDFHLFEERRPFCMRRICRFIDICITELNALYINKELDECYKARLDMIVETKDEKVSSVELDFLMRFFLGYLVMLNSRDMDKLNHVFQRSLKEIPLKEFRDLAQKAKIHRKLMDDGVYPSSLLLTSLATASLIALESAYERKEWEVLPMLIFDAGSENLHIFLNRIKPFLMADPKRKAREFALMKHVGKILTQNYKHLGFMPIIELWGLELTPEE